MEDICAEGGRPDLLQVQELVCGTRAKFTKYLALVKTEGTPSKKLAAVVLCCLIWRKVHLEVQEGGGESLEWAGLEFFGENRLELFVATCDVEAGPTLKRQGNGGRCRLSPLVLFADVYLIYKDILVMDKQMGGTLCQSALAVVLGGLLQSHQAWDDAERMSWILSLVVQMVLDKWKEEDREGEDSDEKTRDLLRNLAREVYFSEHCAKTGEVEDPPPVFEGLLDELDKAHLHHANQTWRPWDVAVHFESRKRGLRQADKAAVGNPPSTMRTISFTDAQLEIDGAAARVLRKAGLTRFDPRRARVILTHMAGKDRSVLGNILGPKRLS